MDRFSFLAMGRRRPWVVGAQFGLVGSMLAMGFVPDPVNNIMLLTWVAFAVNSCAALQDVAVDGMAIDVLPVEERGRANAFMAFGQVAGYSASGAVSASALIIFGLEGAAGLLAVLIGAIFALAVRVRERAG
ncbi:MAG: MFS transporter [Gammaproteobacteria bacterium]|nr:MFS transporter [Gammaproteobacteria bacterium]